MPTLPRSLLRLGALLPVLAASLALARAPSGAPGELAADLVLRGGRVFLADGNDRVLEALAVRAGRVVLAGSSAEVAPLIGPETRVIELAGRLVTPGFNDAHLHFGSGGISLLEVDLRGTTSLAQIQERVRDAAAAAAPGEWITGRGWDHTRLPPGELGPDGWPTRAALDQAAPEHPVWLRRVDGHVGWANTRAIREVGIGPETPAPAGGEIARDPRTGEPTGIFKEEAMGLFTTRIPAPSESRIERGIRAAMELAARSGVTSVQSSASAAELPVYQRLRDSGELTVRVYAWLPLDRETIEHFSALGVRAPFGNDWLRIGLLKGYVDGTLGSRTAWMLEPYADDPTTRGIQRMGAGELDTLVTLADRAGLQLALHAIGDGGNRLVLDAIEAARRVNGPRDARHRIEHAQILDAADLGRFRALGVIASMQPTHATSDMRWVEQRIGAERAAEGAYVWRKLLDAGASVAFGTDFIVEPMPPVEGLYSAVTRQSREERGEPPGGWLPSQRLSIQEAIRLYTAASAFAEFQEDRKGTLEPGMLADFVVWDRDLLTIRPVEILDAEPVLTVVGGRVVWERGGE